MTSRMIRKIFVLFLATLSTALSVFAQELRVSGTVTEALTGETVPGAAVMVKGTGNGTSAGMDGKWSLTVAPDAVLVCQAFGYKTQEVQVNGRAVIDFVLELGPLGQRVHFHPVFLGDLVFPAADEEQDRR